MLQRIFRASSVGRMTKPAPPTGRTDRQSLIEERLGESLEAFVLARRPDTSWRLIASEIIERTGVDLTGEALRGWFS